MPDNEVSYPLSPLQQGMLFHSLFAPESGVDIEQVICTLREPLNQEVFQRAWETVVSRHAVLRTCFQWTNRDTPLQIVRSSAGIEWRLENWRQLTQVKRTEGLEQFLEQDRRRDFVMNRAPLMRLALFNCGSDLHKFVWTFHHAILDGRSFPIVLSEVFKCYRAHLACQEPDLAPPIPFGTFLNWLQERPRENEERFWREELEGFTAPTPISSEKAPASRDAPGLQLASEQRLTAGLTRQLQSAADSLSVTMNTFVQGAWALLLSHYSGSHDGHRDVVYGNTRACRHGTVGGAESMVGLFINTVPLRVSWEAGTTTRDFLKQVRAKHLALRPVEHTALADIQRWSEVPSSVPLFESLLVFEKRSLDDLLRARGGAWRQRSFEYRGQTNFPLALIVYGGEELMLRIECDSNRLDPHMITRMSGHLGELLSQMVSNLDAPVDALPYVTAEERQSLLGLSRVQTTADVSETLHERFESRVAEDANRVAVTYEGQAVSYGELNRKANRLAHHLRDRGVGPNVLVGLATERDIDVLVGILGILKAGGAYVPIDLAYPAQRLAFMIDDCGAPVLLTQSALVEQLPHTDAAVICIDDLPLGEAAPDTNPEHRNTTADLAYVIYTSGSTGNPKGALITHENVIRLFTATDTWFQFNQEEVWTLFHSYAFDFSVWEIWGALLYGGRVVVVPYLVSRSPEDFYALLSREKVTVLNQTPSAFRQLIQAERALPEPLPLALRYVVFGGEALEMQSLKPWFDRHGDQQPKLINMYGITETTVHVTYRPLSADDLDGGSVIGIPIPDLQVYILDSYGNPVPIGVPGEMFVGGKGLARGYLNRDRLTAQRFIPHPFSDVPGDRLYRTGDLGRFLPNRDIEYLGRIDHQVKIRGFRIELGEIESVLCEHPAVREAVVTAREDAPGERRLVAYLVCDQPQPSNSQLREHLKSKLPEYMVPAACVYMDKLPLTGNGKVDRKALPAPDEQRPQLADRYVAPRTPVEKRLAAIWSDVLRIERVGVHDNYFELGGDSIQSTLVVSAARKIDLQLTPKQLFDCPTIAQLASVAVHREDSTANEQGPVEGDSPLTPIQHWFFEQQLADPHHYNQAFLFDIREPLDEDLLRRAIDAVQCHHDALRLRFRCEGNVWHQEFAARDACIAPLEHVDLSTVSGAQIAAEVTRVATGFQSGLDLAGGPLWRVAVIHFADGNCQLLVTVHHLAIDGVSWRILLEDLEKGYCQAQQGEKITLSPKTTSFKSWAERLQQFAKSTELATERAHWNQIAAIEHAPIPTDATGGANKEGNNTDGENTESAANTITVSLTDEESEDLLQRVPQAYNTMINDVLLTALARSVESWTGNRQVLINLEGHGREDLFDGVDLTRTLGWFTTIYPVQLDLPESRNPQDALKAVKEQLRSVPQRGIGYGVLRYLAGEDRVSGPSTPRNLSPLRDPEIVFNYFGKFDDVVRGSQLFDFAEQNTGPWHSPRQRRRHALEINCMIIRGRLEIQWTYSSSLHSKGTIEAVAEEFLWSLRELIQHCISSDAGGYTPSDFPLCGLDQSALDHLVARSRDIEDIYPPSPIQLLFLARAANQNDAILDHWQCTLSGDLDVEAFQRAWQDVFDCHPVLRTAIRSEGLREPLQVVQRQVQPTWTIDDWAGRPADQHEKLWQQLLREDRAIGMELDRPPLSRFTLVRLDANTHRFLWSVPALLLDGWSWPLVFADVSKAYQGHLRHENVVLEKARTYRDYLGWLKDHASSFDQGVSGEDGKLDVSQREFWQANLKGMSEPTSLLSESPPDFKSDSTVGSDPFDRVYWTLDSQTIDQLQKTMRAHQTTIGALVQAAWSIVLSRLSGRQDITFGAAFSGRPTDLAGAESMVGPFVNNLPVRVKLTGDESLGDLVTASHDRLLRLNPHQFVPSTQIQSWSDVPWQHRLFDSLVVVQNYVVHESARLLGPDVSIEDFEGPIHTNFPLLVLVEPDSDWGISIIFDRRAIAPAAIERWKCDLTQVLQCMAEDLNANVDTVMGNLSQPIKAEHAHRKLVVQSQNYVPPRTPTQKAIARVWRDTIQLDRISIEDNLFDLGAHSLLVVQLHKKLQDDLDRQMELVTLFRYPTILALAQHLDSGHQGSDRVAQSQDRGQRQRQMFASMRNARSRIKR